MVVHHHRRLDLVGMIAWIIEKILGIAHLKPIAGSNKEVGIACKQIANHTLKGVTTMPVNDNEFAKALMIERVYNVGKYGFLRFVTGVHTERQFSLTWVLRAHGNGWHHHGVHPMLGEQALAASTAMSCDKMQSVR